MGLTSSMKSTSASRQSGAVSLFVVIFAMLLITVVTIGFLRLMINDQSQATNNDLSQSALDSAGAGVEDAKRALLRLQEVCKADLTPTKSVCNDLAARLNSIECNAALKEGNVISSGAFGAASNGKTGEVRVQQTVGDTALEQAYTCVTLDLTTEDYLGSATANQSKLIPLVGENSFDRVTIEWFSREDIAGTSAAVDRPSSGQALRSNWPSNRPSVLRSQFMQVGSSFTLQQFDYATSTESNGNTTFLYPAINGYPQPVSLNDVDVRTSDPANEPPSKGEGVTPLPVGCSPTLDQGGYACSAVIILPTPIGGGTRTAMLRLTPFYNATHYRVTLTNGATPVNFSGVQPIIDSTGRANDLFRRVQTRVDMYDTSFPYPEAAVDVTGNFCKDFSVGWVVADYRASNSGVACNP